MNKSTVNLSIVAAEAIVAALTLLLYFLTSWGADGGTIEITALVFVLLAETTLFSAVLIISNLSRPSANMAFIWSGFSAPLTIYWLFTIIMALLCPNYYTDTRKFILHETIGLALTAVILIGMYLAAVKIGAADAAALSRRNYMREVTDIVFLLKTTDGYEEFAERLNAVYDRLKYSDMVKRSSMDEALMSETAKIEKIFSEGKRDASEIGESIAKLEEYLSQRDVEIAAQARGRL